MPKVKTESGKVKHFAYDEAGMKAAEKEKRRMMMTKKQMDKKMKGAK